MKKLALALSLYAFATLGYAQDKTIMNYNGHWYVPGDNNLDKEALQYHQLITEKAAFDTMAKGKDVFVTRTQYMQTMQELDKLMKDEMLVPNSMETSASLKSFYDLAKYLKIVVQGNDDYRRMLNTATQRVIMARREGAWSNELFAYVVKEAVVSLVKNLSEKSSTDMVLAATMAELQKDERYQSCMYNIVVDNRMMDDPAMQMFICDRMEYIMGADIYRYRESTPGVVSNYAKRKKESAALMGWLMQRVTTDRSKFITMADFQHNPGSKPNEILANLQKKNDWYIFIFYKGVLYYSDALPKCENSSAVSIMYKP